MVSVPHPIVKDLELKYFRRLTVNKLEDVVEDEVLALGIASKLESLGVVHGALLLVNLFKEIVSHAGLRETLKAIVSSYQELASHQDDNTAIDQAGLGIEGRDLVLDLLEGEALSSQPRQQRVHKFGGIGGAKRTASFSVMA